MYTKSFKAVVCSAIIHGKFQDPGGAEGVPFQDNAEFF